MRESTVTIKGQTTLPRDVRAALGLKSGDKLRYVVMNGEVRLLKARPVAELEGVLARPGTRPISLDEMDDAIAAGATDGMRPAK
ncbi:AbrB/MazE/SpoVT family DNA-binding domain-containing protein [Phaeovulum sp.]|uniref:AbrB/MazE/SpoVT family DNA-binding domain-containing protein n=1 Tax=Phaeovulum sp. TaxID=2934796 RepID=UPI00273099DB|nr:type II toxin-antitoxin system PrlF family antitoxin [Phaeovulum sp.]MDP1669667.1 type II toxin-antitoxin system PrlF family antitoxin [Phaeovulum sp.]MDZ4117859.1 type II toxin-antitoxin system PrlF family antitoxin [Phaeovulum sp.]